MTQHWLMWQKIQSLRHRKGNWLCRIFFHELNTSMWNVFFKSAALYTFHCFSLILSQSSLCLLSVPGNVNEGPLEQINRLASLPLVFTFPPPLMDLLLLLLADESLRAKTDLLCPIYCQNGKRASPSGQRENSEWNMMWLLRRLSLSVWGKGLTGWTGNVSHYTQDMYAIFFFTFVSTEVY